MTKPSAMPPALALKFFRWYCKPGLKKSIEGDLIELYRERLSKSGKLNADLLIITDVLILFRPGIIRTSSEKTSLNHYDMFKNYFTIGFRNIFKYKAFSFINVFGLALAMSVCMLLILILADQNRYDKFNKNGNATYRILSQPSGGNQPYSTSPFPTGSALSAEYTVARKTTTLVPGVGGDALAGMRVSEMRGYFATPSFFDVFSFTLENGDATHALGQPYSMVVTQAVAEKLFPHENPVGQVVEFSDRQLPFPVDYGGVVSAPVLWGSFTITGVIDDSKYRSHLKFDVLVSASTLPSLYAGKKIGDASADWEGYYHCYTYVSLKPGKTSGDLDNALQSLVKHHYAGITSEDLKGFSLKSQALYDIQLNPKGNDTNNRLPDIGYYFLAVLAAVIMISACLNYTNLSVARALTRAKEIGVRKITGAFRKDLVFQFLSESVITALLALAMGVLFLLLLKPAFKSLWVNQYLNFELPETFTIYGIFIAFAVGIGCIAGFFPALHLSGYQPIKALKALEFNRKGIPGTKKVLSVSQFVISLFFITTSLLIYRQFTHFLQFDYGFNASNIVNVELQGLDQRKVKNEFRAIPGINVVAASDIIPSTGRHNGMEFRVPGKNEDYLNASILIADENFIQSLDIKLLAGNNLTEGNPDKKILVNQAMVTKLGYQHPSEIIGLTIESKWGNEALQIIGVVSDFRYNLLINRHEIEPMVIRNLPAQFSYALVKITSHDVTGTMAALEQKWKKLDPIHPIKYEFYDRQLAATHQGIFDLVSILGFISFIAITVACLGLLGMATYAVERRKKEVGIRKVLGAAIASITLLLSKQFIRMLLIAIVIASPLTYFVNNLWLQRFPNRVEFGFGTLLSGIAVLLVLGFVTIGSQTFRAAKRNPVDSLKMD